MRRRVRVLVAAAVLLLPAMRRHGAFSMAFSDYGQAPPVQVPTPSV